MQPVNKNKQAAAALRSHTNECIARPPATANKARAPKSRRDLCVVVACVLHNRRLMRWLWPGGPVLCPPHCHCPCEHDTTNPRAYPPPSFWIQIRVGRTSVGACAGHRCAATILVLVLRLGRSDCHANRCSQMVGVVTGRYFGSPYTGVARHPFIALCGQIHLIDQFAEARFVQQPPMKARGLGVACSVRQRH